ncbi:MAG: BMP family ABC transporter substrate-binding protein [Armatimonadota bacterium]|nr:BMP family ABC transporter substrate-binding protein [Armatimonadota bacterium]MDR7401741.1 BMP family ABC transporter substrate-binding protein [Armatimonadota bacterium]MDR7404133.1 BMP family ABC transporter substrate-binding protein [Armatimonadota bacterium]MDR7436256.1 BMP family ABC transporter substrate-binding protein [Armatimonadota bacterium]MDR7471364.1 BMP family ABC transporter substrate-binding protein [Armatimonadota bacterium]
MRGTRWAVAAVLAVLLLAAAATGYGQQKLKVGFIYVGPIGDYGWTHAHDVGRRIVEQQLPVQTLYVESVPEGRVEPFIDRLVAQGARVIFTTSFGFMDGTLAAAQRYPNVIFAHASGFKRARNMATYMADFYQVYYLNGLMAGALTRTNKIGYVGAFPIPEVKRHLNAFALGVRAVNPRATVHVRWIFEWFSPAKAKEATQALIAEGVDVFAFTEDSPTVIQEAAKKNLLSFAHYSPMYRFAPRHVVSGQLVHWETIYLDFLRKVLAGKYTPDNLQNVDYWWLLAEKAVELGAEPGMMINPLFTDQLKAVRVRTPDLGTLSVYDLVLRRHAQMSAKPVKFDPFTGPIRDRKGVLRVPAGHTLTVQELITLEWAAPGVVGPWPNEP